MRIGWLRRRSAPTAARSSPPAGTRRPGCGTPPPARSCNGSRMRAAVIAASFSPDGRTRPHRQLRQDGPAVGRRQRQGAATPLTHEDEVRGGVVQPRRPHRRSPSATTSTARLWDAAQRQGAATSARMTERVNTASFSPDGRTRRHRQRRDGPALGRHRGQRRSPPWIRQRAGCGVSSPDGDVAATAGTDAALGRCQRAHCPEGIGRRIGVVQPRRPHGRHRQRRQDRPVVGRRQRQGAATAHA